MPRIFYVFIFLIVAVIPVALIWIGQVMFDIASPPKTQTTPQATTSNYQSHSYGHHHHGWGSPFFWGGVMYYGDRGRGGWLNRSYTHYNKSGGGFFGSSRSYSGGSSSFGGGSFGSFGK